MRLRMIGFLLALPLLSATGFAQTGPQSAAVVENSAAAPSNATPSRPAGITREQYLQRAQERAVQRAGARFDEMDTDHDGVLDRAELRAWRSQHPRRAAAQPAAPTQQ
jgi:hypothetical protein